MAAATLGFVEQAPPAAPAPTGSRWQPARHEQDDWFDAVPGRHRVLFDTCTWPRFGEGVMFAGNYFRANKDTYGLTDRDLAFVIVMRHQTAPFAFNDAMWAKCGKAFAKRMEYTDPKVQQPPTTNPYNRQVSNLVKQGVQLAVCSLTTSAYSQIIADETHVSVDDVFKELAANTLGNAHFVPAGIVAATRAQERGYAIINIG